MRAKASEPISGILTKCPAKLDNNNAKIVAPIIESKALRNKGRSPSRAANAKALKGNINGAINIAPIITAVLLLIKPKVAIKQALMVNTI